MTPGTIGVLSLELSRYAYFNASLSCIKKPEGTSTIWSIGKNVLDAQNYLVENTVGDWLWILGDDHEFGEDALMNLLAHDADVVCPVNVQRALPFWPMVYDHEGNAQDWSSLDGKFGLKPVHACGNAGMLIKKHVFEKIPAPWFQWGPEGSPYHGSDLAFCWKARQAGFKVHIDTDTTFGHTTVCTFVPVRIGPNGEFGVALRVQGQTVAYFKFKPGQQNVLFEQRNLREELWDSETTTSETSSVMT